MPFMNTHACAEPEMRLRSEKRDQERLGRTLPAAPGQGRMRVFPARVGSCRRPIEGGWRRMALLLFQALISSSPAPIQRNTHLKP